MIEASATICADIGGKNLLSLFRLSAKVYEAIEEHFQVQVANLKGNEFDKKEG